MDTVYVNAVFLVSSRLDYELDLIGPTHANYRKQARQKARFDANSFHIDWQAEQATYLEWHSYNGGRKCGRTRKGDQFILEKGATWRRSDPSSGYIRRFTHDEIASCIGDNLREVLETLAHLDNNTPQYWIYAW